MSHKPGGRLPLLSVRPAVSEMNVEGKKGRSTKAQACGPIMLVLRSPQPHGSIITLYPTNPIQQQHARLRVRSTVQRYQSAERPILHQISSLMYARIQRKRVVMTVLQPGCAQPPRWSPPVFWTRLEDTELHCSATFDYSWTVFFIHISTPE